MNGRGLGAAPATNDVMAPVSRPRFVIRWLRPFVGWQKVAAIRAPKSREVLS